LFGHATGRWCKKIRGKFHYFGKWDDPDGALQRYLDQKDDLYAGRVPRVKREGLTVKDLVNRFLTFKRARVDTGELVQRSWADYHRACARVLAVFGKDRLVNDLDESVFGELRTALAKTLGPVALGNEIQRIRVVFKWGYDEALIEQPIRYGQSFKRPTRKVLRKIRQANGKRMFEAHEIRAMIDKAGIPLKAMILLGINCGYGNSDCATLPGSAVDLKAGWISYPRPKTAVERRCPLWPETVSALREAMDKRPKPKDQHDDGLIFLTKQGRRWGKDTSDNPISKETRKILSKLGIGGRRGFYALRHTHQTVGDETRDPIAVQHTMGHAENSNDMSAVYRERINDERLRAVTDHVRRWLFGGSIDLREPTG
jgi:integrase